MKTLMMSEKKLDNSFPTAQFLLSSFCAPHRLDKNSKDGGILLYVREDIHRGFLIVNLKLVLQLFLL